MHIIATTRFNTKTWKENESWREKNQYQGCIYGCPKQICIDITPTIPMFILEMHNDENKVKGIGFIKNSIIMDKLYRIYEDRNYNRYTYKSKYRIDRTVLSKKEETIIKIFDGLLFKGSGHLKRGQGITSIPSWMANNKHINFVKFFKELFSKYYPEL